MLDRVLTWQIPRIVLVQIDVGDDRCKDRRPGTFSAQVMRHELLVRWMESESRRKDQISAVHFFFLFFWSVKIIRLEGNEREKKGMRWSFETETEKNWRSQVYIKEGRGTRVEIWWGAGQGGSACASSARWLRGHVEEIQRLKRDTWRRNREGGDDIMDDDICFGLVAAPLKRVWTWTWTCGRRRVFSHGKIWLVNLQTNPSLFT